MFQPLLSGAGNSASVTSHPQRYSHLMLRIVFLIALLGGAVPLAADAQALPRGVCVITSVDGAPLVSARGVRSWTAEVGLGLGRDASLRTGPGARATLACDGDLRVIVGPDTEFVVLRLLEDAPKISRLRIVRGIVGFLFGNDDPDRGIEVRTPSAVAAVRSTEWAMRVTGGASAVCARDGTVFVFGETGPARLEPGDGIDVAADGTSGAVARWGQPRIDRFSELLGPNW